MAITVFRDEEAIAVILEVDSDGAGGMRFYNELRAVGNGDGTINIPNPPRGTRTDTFLELSNIPFSDFVDESGDPIGGTEEETVNNLNALLRQTGGSPGVAPVITSPTSITVVDGDPVNYVLTATDGVGYEWDNIPLGLATKNGNLRHLIGVVAGGVGVYTPEMTAVNYYGHDTKTLTITVTAAFSNTKSIRFRNWDWMGATAASLDPVLGRVGNGSGAGDAWTIHCWFRGSTSRNESQTIFYYGSDDVFNEHQMRMYWNGNTVGNRQLVFRYGSAFNYLEFKSPANTISSSSGWHHLMMTYDGGTTGEDSGSLASYYSRFKMFIDGSLVATTDSHEGYGIADALTGKNLRIGRHVFGGFMRNRCHVDEVALWDSDQAANIATIYNGGVTQDLSLLGTPPEHWWRMGDGDTFPTIKDNIGSVDFTMYNMSPADIINDVP